MFGIAVRGGGDRRVEERQLVLVLREALRPLREDRRRARDVGGRRLQPAVESAGVTGAGVRAPPRRSMRELGDALVRAILEGLAHDQRRGVGLHAQPVARLLAAREEDLEAAVGVDLHLARVEVAGLAAARLRAVAARVGAEAEVVHGAAPARDPVLVLAADRRVLVVVVGVVGADLHRLVRGAAQHREQRVGELDVRLERHAREARQVAEALGAIEGVHRRAGPQHHVAGALQRVAEIGPGRAVENALRGIGVAHGARVYSRPPAGGPMSNVSEEHPARLAARRSMEAVHAKDKDAWVANFADDGVVEDPIGPSIFDPEGKGHRGKAAIAAFWDKLIGPNRVFFDLRESFACGSECANVGSVNTVLPNGAIMIVNGVFTYRVDAHGKVLALRAYWEMARMKSVSAGK